MASACLRAVLLAWVSSCRAAAGPVTVSHRASALAFRRALDTLPASVVSRRVFGALLATPALLGLAPGAQAAAELSEEAAVVAEAWADVKRAYVDGGRLSALDWEGKRKTYLRERKYRSMDDARAAVRELIATLDDRWTRLISPDELALTARRYGVTSSTEAVDGASDGVLLLTTSRPDGRTVALLRIGRMGAQTPERVRAALRPLAAAPPSELWLDLRGNLGGSFGSAVEVGRLFLRAGQRIVTVRRRSGPVETFDALDDGPYAALPLHVLVDRNTASAAEVLAGALRDNERADLRGERTYGKGVIQTVAKLSDGSALEITVARYETPAGRSINQRGFEPDVPLGAECAAQVPIDAEGSRAEANRGLACVQAMQAA